MENIDYKVILYFYTQGIRIHTLIPVHGTQYTLGQPHAYMVYVCTPSMCTAIAHLTTGPWRRDPGMGTDKPHLLRQRICLLGRWD